MEPNRDNPLSRFAAFWWGIGVISLFFVTLLIVRISVGGGDGDDPLEQAAAIQRYQTRAMVDSAQQANFEPKVVEEGVTAQVDPETVFALVGKELVASKPTKQEDPLNWGGEGDPPGAGEVDLGSVDAMTPEAGTAPDPEAMAIGETAFAVCMACHGQNGEGGPIAPPLAGSDWVTGPVSNLIRIQLRGLTGPITVSGEDYNFPAPMAPLAYQTDEQIAGVLTYVRNSFGNSAPPVLPEQVAALRDEVGKPMMTQSDLIGLGDEAPDGE